MIPDQTVKTYIKGIEMIDAAAGSINAHLRDGWLAFWSDPVGQAPVIEAEAAACGMTPFQIFHQHAACLQWLAVSKPSRISWFTGIPIEMPFNEDGTIDKTELESRWESHLSSIPLEE